MTTCTVYVTNTFNVFVRMYAIEVDMNQLKQRIDFNSDIISKFCISWSHGVMHYLLSPIYFIAATSTLKGMY